MGINTTAPDIKVQFVRLLKFYNVAIEMTAVTL